MDRYAKCTAVRQQRVDKYVLVYCTTVNVRRMLFLPTMMQSKPYLRDDDFIICFYDFRF